MDALLFLVGAALIANTIYGIVCWRRTMPPGPRRTLHVVVAVFLFQLTALVMLVYVPVLLWRRSQAVS